MGVRVCVCIFGCRCLFRSLSVCDVAVRFVSLAGWHYVWYVVCDGNCDGLLRDGTVRAWVRGRG